jgi:hypothetical protein
MTESKRPNDGMPTIGLMCRQNKRHIMRETGDSGRERKDINKNGQWVEAWYYEAVECEFDCGVVGVKRYDRWFRFLRTETTYTEKEYLVPGGVDEDHLGILRQQRMFPNAKMPKRRPPLGADSHLKAV